MNVYGNDETVTRLVNGFDRRMCNDTQPVLCRAG